MKVKIYLLMLICSLAIFLLTGCYYVQGVEAKAYAIALGIDVSDTHNLILNKHQQKHQNHLLHLKTLLLAILPFYLLIVLLWILELL